MKTRLILICLLLAILFSCKRTNPFIIETDIERISTNSIKNGLTIKENENLAKLIVDTLRKNTIGKVLPGVMVTDLSNQKLNLLDGLDKLNGNFIIISSDVHCGFGLDCMTNLFPEALKQSKAHNMDIETVCLLKKTEFDIKDSIKFIKTLKQIKPFYQTIFIIDERLAGKLNMSINPTRLYVNKNMIVSNIEFGIPMVAELYHEIEQNTIGNN